MWLVQIRVDLLKAKDGDINAVGTERVIEIGREIRTEIEIEIEIEIKVEIAVNAVIDAVSLVTLVENLVAIDLHPNIALITTLKMMAMGSAVLDWIKSVPVIVDEVIRMILVKLLKMSTVTPRPIMVAICRVQVLFR
jgi:hypothetical protein